MNNKLCWTILPALSKIKLQKKVWLQRGYQAFGCSNEVVLFLLQILGKAKAICRVFVTSYLSSKDNTKKVVWGLNGQSETHKFNSDPSPKRLKGYSSQKVKGFTYSSPGRFVLAAALHRSSSMSKTTLYSSAWGLVDKLTSRGIKVSVPSGHI